MLLRRTKNLVTNLPAKRIFVCKIQMSEFQQRIYHMLYPRTSDIKTTKGYNSARQMASSLKTCLRWELNKLRRIPEAIREEIAEKSDKECSGNFAELLHMCQILDLLLAKCCVADKALEHFIKLNRIVLFFTKYVASGETLLDFLDHSSRRIGWLSGSVKDQKKKDQVLDQFQNKKLDALIATYDSGFF